MKIITTTLTNGASDKLTRQLEPFRKRNEHGVDLGLPKIVGVTSYVDDNHGPMLVVLIDA